jgi:hypothetical protein
MKNNSYPALLRTLFQSIETIQMTPNSQKTIPLIDVASVVELIDVAECS